jgi:hypothetical protein
MPGGADMRDELDVLIADGTVCCAELRPPNRVKEALRNFFSPESKPAPTKGTAKQMPAPAAENSTVAARQQLGAEAKASFNARYQAWYSRSLRVVEQLLPDRYSEFRELYRLDRPPERLTEASYRVSDFIHGTKAPTSGLFSEPTFEIADAAQRQFAFQINILKSARSRLDTALADIEGTLQAALLDDELGKATELLKAQHLRSAGVVAGVVLERHLKGVIYNHTIEFSQKIQIANLNDALKAAGVYDVPRWRQIQRLGDIRNLCGHDGEREPTHEEVEELIRKTEEIISKVF